MTGALPRLCCYLINVLVIGCDSSELRFGLDSSSCTWRSYILRIYISHILQPRIGI